MVLLSCRNPRATIARTGGVRLCLRGDVLRISWIDQSVQSEESMQQDTKALC